jgi:choline-sulfatase
MSVSRLFENGKRPNILIIITDQERYITHWPENFSKDNLPAMERLKRHGLDFKHHYTNSCMCSPSRSTLLTSQFPVKTGVTR